jgi:hypothetical protein
MLRLYRHRVNTVRDLEPVPLTFGIEFDLRSDGDRVIVTHDPFTDGPTIDEFFPHIGPRPCIFNVKCEGVEEAVMACAKKNGIEDFFFLDCSVPAAVKLWRKGEKRIAVRYSELEPIEGVMAWADRATWVWVDCFQDYPGVQQGPSDPAWTAMAERFKVCLVSPELQGHGTDAIAIYKSKLGQRRYHAACSKRPDLWTAEA